MTYFREQYGEFRYPVATGDSPGLRPAQIGAIHAVAGHFAARAEAAIVVMPTGTGKTGVLLAAPFVLRARRVLVVVPSRLLRDQLHLAFSDVALLRTTGALPGDDVVPSPKVHRLSKRITTPEQWEDLRGYDVVVATPHTASPARKDIPRPPEDLFDVVLVDEAHHEPAATWRSLIETFGARSVLCSATPFRRDGREIRGRIVFNYSMKKAMDDGSFGVIDYLPVDGDDEAIAKAVEACLVRDREAGFTHHALIRTDTRKRADELLELYASATGLRLSIVHGGYSDSHVSAVLAQVRKGDLDGVVAVDMVAEGVDLPSLKVGGLHSPYKSIGATLQFLGRFSRVGQELGAATLVANPSELEMEAHRLYAQDAVWPELIPDLLAKKIEEEVKLKEALGSFSVRDDADDLSLYSLAPYFHVKVYTVTSADLTVVPRFASPTEVTNHAFSADLATSVTVTCARRRPRWMNEDSLHDKAHQLHVVVYIAEHGLLFVCTSARTESTYRVLSRQLATNPDDVPFFQVRRVLRELEDPRFISVGMRNLAQGTAAPSYKMLAGKSSEQGIVASEGHTHGLGHAFGCGTEDGKDTTLGVSTLSKVWSHRADQVPALVEWCSVLAGRIVNQTEYVVNAQLDLLGVAQRAQGGRSDIYAIAWAEDTLTEPTIIVVDGVRHGPLFDAALVVMSADVHGVEFELRVPSAGVTVALNYRPAAAGSRFTIVNEPDHELAIEVTEESLSLLDYLAGTPPRFYAAQGGFLEGGNWLPTRSAPPDLPPGSIRTSEWVADNVNIEKEAGVLAPPDMTVHQYVESKLPVVDFAFNDDGAGEIADIVTVKQETSSVLVTLYHCKFSGGPKASARVKDLYEVCGQAMKSARWRRKGDVVKQIRHRVSTLGKRVLQGSVADLARIEALADLPWRFKVVVVQPGVSEAKLNAKLIEILAATAAYLHGQNLEKTVFWISE